MKDTKICLTFLCATLFAITANASANDDTNSANANPPNVLKPFGSLQWNDGVSGVITKLNQVSGLKEIKWYVSGYWPDSTNVLGITKTNDLSAIAANLYAGFSTEDFVASDGKTVFAPNKTWSTTITANSINIAGIPFQLTATLQGAPGFAVTFPQSVLAYQTPKGAGVLDAVLTEVELSSSEPTIPDKLDGLIATVKAKYPTGQFNEDKEDGVRSGSIVATDQVGHEFKMTWQLGIGSPQVDVDYVDQISPAKWQEVYQKHLAALEATNPPPTSDLKSGL